MCSSRTDGSHHVHTYIKNIGVSVLAITLVTLRGVDTKPCCVTRE